MRSQLSDFVEMIASRPDFPDRDLRYHLQYARAEGQLNQGSEFGQKVWATQAGARLVEELQRDNVISTRFRFEPTRLRVDIYGILAGFVTEAIESPSPTEYIDGHLDLLMEALHAEVVAGGALWAIDGVEIDQSAPVAIGPWVRVAAASPESVAALVDYQPGRAITVPKSVRAILAASAWGRIEDGLTRTGIDAMGGSAVLASQACLAVWLATGTYPRSFARFEYEDSRYPAFSPQRELTPSRERLEGRFPPIRLSHQDETELSETFWRVQDRSWMDEDGGLDEATILSLRAALNLADSALAVPDYVGVATLACAAMEALLNNRDDGGSQLARRVSQIAARDAQSRQILRKRINALYSIRNDYAHGSRPLVDQVLLAIGRDPRDSSDITVFELLFRVSEDLRAFALDLLSVVLAAGMRLMISLQPSPSGKPIMHSGVSKDRLIGVLDTVGTSRSQRERAEADATLAELLVACRSYEPRRSELEAPEHA